MNEPTSPGSVRRFPGPDVTNAPSRMRIARATPTTGAHRHDSRDTRRAAASRLTVPGDHRVLKDSGQDLDHDAGGPCDQADCGQLAGHDSEVCLFIVHLLFYSCIQECRNEPENLVVMIVVS